jgi:hypothetical protein
VGQRSVAAAHLALNDPETPEKMLLEAHSIATDLAGDIDTFDIPAEPSVAEKLLAELQ